MTEEQKLQWLQGLIEKGVNVAQINLGDGTQNFYVGKDQKVTATQEGETQVVDAEVVEPEVINEDHLNETADGPQDVEFCIDINPKHKAMLVKAIDVGIVEYIPKTQSLKPMVSNTLVAYLCGRIFARDFTDEYGTWIPGGQLEETELMQKLFGFDVAATRRSNQGGKENPKKSPTGYKIVDKLFK